MDTEQEIVENLDAPHDADNPMETEDDEQHEEMLPKSRVEELLKKAKLKGRDKMQEQLDALARENEELKTQMGGMSQPAAQQAQAPLDMEEVKRQITESMRADLEAQRQAQEEEALNAELKKAADTYHQKIAAGKELYEDFDAVMADFDPSAFPYLAYLASNSDNTAEIMYELANNPTKYSSLGVLAERNPKQAAIELAKLSRSIKANQDAIAQEKQTNPPLSRMQPSPTGQDSGSMTINDFKRRYRG